MSYLPISKWSEDDQPREKLLNKGRKALSDAELIAILIGSGSKSLSAVDLSKFILSKVGNDINNLAKLSVKELTQFKGIGEAKAITIISALELGRRRTPQQAAVIDKITCSSDAYQLLKPKFHDLQVEEFWTIMLNRSNKLISIKQISSGGFHGTVADPKQIFNTALLEKASGIIIAHNHPSGNLNASKADLDLTFKLKSGGAMLDIQVLDHLIISDSGYLSLNDEGKM